MCPNRSREGEGRFLPIGRPYGTITWGKERIFYQYHVLTGLLHLRIAACSTNRSSLRDFLRNEGYACCQFTGTSPTTGTSTSSTTGTLATLLATARIPVH